VLYLAFPVIFAAAIHLVVIRYDLFARLKVPIDLGRTVRGQRIFGDHKTWRGALIMVAGSAVGMALQGYVRAPALEFFDYGRVNLWLYGALLGLGFVLAELPNSFLKRRWGVPPGRQAEGATYWVFTLLDQLDSVLGCLLALALVWTPPWAVIAAALVLCSLVHIAFNLVFVWLGLKVRAL
jgi:hypothetical protein